MLAASSSGSGRAMLRQVVARAVASSSSAPAARASAAARSCRWSSSDSKSSASDAVVSGSSSGASDASSPANAASSEAASPATSSTNPLSIKRKLKRERKTAMNPEVLPRRPLSSDSKSASDRSPTAAKLSPAQQFKLGDLASMSALLYHPDPILDSSMSFRIPATRANPFPASVTMHNAHPETDEPVLPKTPPSAASLVLSSSGGGSDEIDSGTYLSSVTPLSQREVAALHRHTLAVRRVVRMTTKGKVASMYALVVAGNGRGLVGYGEGKDINAGTAARKAFHEAVKRMDYVKRFEGRTTFTEASFKWGSAVVTMRPRPAGFGLRVPPAIHSLARAAGLSDLSASIRGSANTINVVKAACQILWSGANPSGLGDGVGGASRRNDRGRGMPDAREIELVRGRKLREVNLGAQVRAQAPRTGKARRSL